MNKHLNELIELSKNDQAIDSYTPQLEAADKKVAKVQKKIDAAQDELDTLTTDIAGNEGKVKTFEEQLTLLNEQLSINAKKLKEISEYTNCAGAPKSALNKIAKFGVVIENWMNENCIDVSAIQCWTSMEEFFGIAPCTIMKTTRPCIVVPACSKKGIKRIVKIRTILPTLFVFRRQ